MFVARANTLEGRTRTWVRPWISITPLSQITQMPAWRFSSRARNRKSHLTRSAC